jgi:GNAT superfamily N-acetyltransferase
MNDDAGWTLTLHEDGEVPAADARIVDAGLGVANEAAAPLHQVRRLASFARACDGTVIGGAIGRTWGSCCELQQLWVEPTWRRQGLGARLVRAFEALAQQRGCRTYYLETFSFQAPRLYEALGYRTQLAIDGFAPGISKFVMVRELARADAP